jgi:hypothetical protein
VNIVVEAVLNISTKQFGGLVRVTGKVSVNINPLAVTEVPVVSAKVPEYWSHT